MNSLRYFVVWLLTLSLSNASAFSPLFSSKTERPTRAAHPSFIAQRGLVVRGGEESAEQPLVETPSIGKSAAAVPGLAAMGSFLANAGRIYTQQIDKYPIFTKSYTAGIIFGLSDYIAQKIENPKGDEGKPKMNKTRLLASTLVGFLYFGPAAHYWYEMIFTLLPGSSMWSTLQKAFWGQAIFGPSFTCVFFATSLLQSGQFSLGAWWQKIKSDLPGAWLAGAGFWPLVDIVSYSMIPVKWIPLFINMCSLVWTVYLSLVSNRSDRKKLAN
jgi:protein Mpv17